MKEVFDFNHKERLTLLKKASELVSEYYESIGESPISSVYTQKEVQDYITSLVNQDRKNRDLILEKLMFGLKHFSVNTPHPMYFGLFNPRTMFATIMSEMLTGATNPQLAAWSHNAFCNEVESYLIKTLCNHFGFKAKVSNGVFCNGGAEANLTAILCACQQTFPSYAKKGWWGIKNQPKIYVTAESHHSVLKAAKIAGLGFDSVIEIATDTSLQMNVNELEQQILIDKKKGFLPMMVVATGGTTGTGTIDPIHEISDICRKFKLWCHVDAAYGGAVILNSEYAPLLKGISQVDSLTLDIHKWLSVQMASSCFLTQHATILDNTFSVKTTYMPKRTQTARDPYNYSVQWSRRTIGMKFFTAILFYGWDAISDLIKNQIVLGQRFKKLLLESGFELRNNTDLPIACFIPKGQSSIERHKLDLLVAKGQLWVSAYPIQDQLTIRACVTNYATTEKDIINLVYLLKKYL